MRDTRPDNSDDPKATAKAPVVYITPTQSHKLIALVPLHTDATTQAKEAQQTTGCIENAVALVARHLC